MRLPLRAHTPRAIVNTGLPCLSERWNLTFARPQVGAAGRRRRPVRTGGRDGRLLGPVSAVSEAVRKASMLQ